MGEIAEVKLGKMLSAKAFEDGLLQLPYLRNQNVRWGHIDYSDLKSMGFKASEVERYSLEPGDLLVCEGGEPGRCAIYTRGSKELMYQKALHRIRSHGSLISPQFLQFCLWHYASNGVVLPRPSETTIQHLPLEEMQELPIPVAPIGEQQRIIEEIEKHFTGLDAAVASLKRIQANLKRYRAAVLKAACEGRLVPTEAELARVEGRGYETAVTLLAKISVSVPVVENFELPEGWSLSTLAQLGEVTGGLTQHSRRENLPMKLPYLRVANVYAGELRLENVREIGVEENEIEKALLAEGDLLIVEGNGSEDQIGRVALWNGAISPCLHQNHLIKVRFHNPKIAKYALLWLLSWYGRDQIRRVASSTSGLYTLSLSKVASIPIALPPLAEQGRVVEEVERRISFADEIRASISADLLRSRSLRQTILRKAFEGRLVAQDPNDEPASALLERIRQAKTSQAAEPRARKERTKPTLAPSPSPPPPRGAHLEPPEGAPARSPGREPRVESAPLIPKPPEGATALSPRRGLGNHDDPQTRGSRPGLRAGAPSGGSKLASTPRPPARAEEPPPPAEPEPEPQEADFLELSRDEQVDIAWETLLGQGTLEKDAAVRTVADGLRSLDLARFKRLRHDGPLYGTIAAALEKGVRDGSFDRPRRGCVRAVLSDPQDYTDEVWQRCLLAVIGDEPSDIDSTLRSAAEWARETMGLEYARLREAGVILTGLREALEVEVRAGRIVRRGGRLWRG